MRVLIASDAFPPKVDGVSDTAALITRTLRARGHRVAVLTAIRGEQSFGDVPVVRVRSVPFPLYPEVRASWPFQRANQVVRRFRPDAAIVLTPGPVGLAVTRALQPATRLVHIYTTDIPHYLRDYHLGCFAPLVERQLRNLTARAFVTLCPTETVGADLERRGHIRVEVWGRGVDTALFHPGRRDDRIRSLLCGGEPEKTLVMYVGRLAREKRLDDLRAAAQRLPGLRFAIVGDGPLRDRLERDFAPLSTVFTGYLRGEELATAFASADIFAFPSESETFGQVVLQAMASGVPPVVVRGTAPAEFVPCPSAGLHVPARSPDALADAIRGLARDPARRAMMGRASVAEATRFSWDALIDRLEGYLGCRRD